MPNASNAGVKINYEVVGHGPPLVLHVGFLGRLQDWSRPDVGIAQALQEHFRLILLDPRGFGASDKPHDPNAYSAEHVASDVVAVLDAVGVEQAHYLGYSRGGSIGYAVAHFARSRLRSLVLGGTSLAIVDPVRLATLTNHADVLRTSTMADYLARFWITPETGAELATVWARNDRLALAAEREATAGWPFHDFLADLPELHLPVLLYCGDQDSAYSNARESAEVLPNATFLSLPGLNHGLAFRARDAVVPHVRAFLDRATAGPSP